MNDFLQIHPVSLQTCTGNLCSPAWEDRGHTDGMDRRNVLAGTDHTVVSAGMEHTAVSAGMEHTAGVVVWDQDSDVSPPASLLSIQMLHIFLSHTENP